jgi:esterase
VLLNYRHIGHGPALVLIHGLFGSLDNLMSFGRAMADRYSVISIDLRNHGESPRAPTMALSEMAQDVCDTMDHLGFGHFAILGHSLGGKVAMATALLHPQRVAALVIADIAPVTYGATRHDDVFQALSSLPLASMQTRGEALAFMQDNLQDPAIAEFLLKGLRKTPEGGFQLRYNVPVLRSDYQNIAAWPLSGLHFNGPVRFIKGSESDYVTAEHAEAIEQQFPRASLRAISGAGHWLHAQKPIAFNRLAEKFLQEVYPA